MRPLAAPRPLDLDVGSPRRCRTRSFKQPKRGRSEPSHSYTSLDVEDDRVEFRSMAVSRNSPPSASAHSHSRRLISRGIRSIVSPAPPASVITAAPSSDPFPSPYPRLRSRPVPLRLPSSASEDSAVVLAPVPAAASEESIVVLPPVPRSAASAQPTSSSGGTHVRNFSRQSLFRITKPSSRRLRRLSHDERDVLNPTNATTRSFTSIPQPEESPLLRRPSSPPTRTQLTQDPVTKESEHWHSIERLEALGRPFTRPTYNPFNLPDIPSPDLDSTFNMTTSPHTPTSRGADFPTTSPTNHTPKEIQTSKSPSTSSSTHRQRDNADPENPPQIPSSPSEQSIPWTPAHPCYPHPNPHVPRQDPRATSTRVIRVQRDWSNAGDLYPQFSDTYPEILAPWITEREFRSLITDINDASHAAYVPTTARAWFDATMGLLTGWLWEDLGFAAGKAGARKCERTISTWNAAGRQRRSAERGTPAVAIDKGASKTEAQDVVECVSLRRTAWMSLDFVIPDPKISVVPESSQAANGAARGAGAAHSPITPRGSGERRGERDRRETSRRTSRKSSGADKEGRGGTPASVAAAAVPTGDVGWTRDIEKDGHVGMAI